MANLNKKLDLMKRASPAKPGKRFVSFFIDYVIVLILSAILFNVGGFNIVNNIDEYAVAEQKMEEEIDYFREYIQETKLVKFYYDSDDDSYGRYTTDIVALDNCNRAIVRSYELFVKDQETPQLPSGAIYDIYSKDDSGNYIYENLSEYFVDYENDPTGFNTDTVSFFYTQYLYENNQLLENGKYSILNDDEYLFMEQSDYIKYSQDLYKKSFKNYETMFVYDERDNITKVPVLSSQISFYLFHYLHVDESSENYNEGYADVGKEYWGKYRDYYSTMVEKGVDLMYNSEPYYSTHYVEYVKACDIQATYANTALLICVFISTLIGVFLPKILFKDGQTLGRKLFKLAVIREDEERVPLWIELVKSSLGIFGFMWVIIVIYMFPPLNGSFVNLARPFIGPITVFDILAIIALISILNSIFCLFTHNKTNLLDMLFKTEVVDMKRLDEVDVSDNSPHEGRSY